MLIEHRSLQMMSREERIMHINDAMPTVPLDECSRAAIRPGHLGLTLVFGRPPPHHPHLHVPHNRPINN
jgi:hypothetical protein